MVLAFNPSIWEAEEGGSLWIWGHPGLHSKFQFQWGWVLHHHGRSTTAGRQVGRKAWGWNSCQELSFWFTSTRQGKVNWKWHGCLKLQSQLQSQTSSQKATSLNRFRGISSTDDLEFEHRSLWAFSFKTPHSIHWSLEVHGHVIVQSIFCPMSKFYLVPPQSQHSIKVQSVFWDSRQCLNCNSL